MNIKKFVYKSVNSTNDIAIKLIKKSKIKAGLIVSEKQKKGRGKEEKNGFPIKEIYLLRFFLV